MMEVARAMEGDLEAVEVALWAARAWYPMLMGVQDILHCYQDNCHVFLDWQAAWGMLVDLGESRDVGLPSNDNDLPLA